MRRTVSQVPRQNPWYSYASRAYIEQVGTKRHGDGRPMRAMSTW